MRDKPYLSRLPGARVYLGPELSDEQRRAGFMWAQAVGEVVAEGVHIKELDKRINDLLNAQRDAEQRRDDAARRKVHAEKLLRRAEKELGIPIILKGTQP